MSDVRKINDNEAYCSHCGAVIFKIAEICPKCGCRVAVAQTETANKNNSEVSIKTIISVLLPLVVMVLGILLLIIAC